MGSMLSMGGFVALGFIACSMIFGFSLGLIFSAGGSVLYSTSNVLHQYRTDQHVAASLSLFASVALLFFYILQFMMSFAGGGDD
jgi:FtsH-binding integral membrane protein